MPLKSKEARAAYQKQYNIDNRERQAARQKLWIEKKTAEEQVAYRKQYRIDNNERTRERERQWAIDNPIKAKKNQTVGSWKASGIKGDLSFIYDCAYITATHCWVCKTAFKSTYDRCCDHNHDTGEFRNVLCRACNNHDNWQKLL